MQEQINKIKPEVIEKQMKAVIEEVATLEIQHAFIKEDLDKRIKKAEKIKNKDEREKVLENFNQQKLQKVHPIEDNIKYKKTYYDYLCTLESSATE